MNFRLLSDTPIAPAGRRLSGADIFAPPAEVCGTDFPLLPSLLGVAPGCACVVTAFLNCFFAHFFYCCIFHSLLRAFRLLRSFFK